MAFSTPSYKNLLKRGLWLVLLSLSSQLASADFTVRSVETTLQDKVYLLNARIDFQFSDAALDALNNGVPLILLLDIEVEKERDWWWNKTVAKLEQGYLLLYHALTENYLVTNLNSSAQNNYRSLGAALAALGRVESLPLIDTKLVEADARYFVRLRVHLDIESLPVPMRPIAYLSPDWRLESDWYTWPLQR